MKNLMPLIAIISCLLFTSCEKDQLFGESNPVKIQEFEIDGVAYDQNDLSTTIFELSEGEGISLHYFLQDDRKIDSHSLFFLVNDDGARRRQIELHEDVDSEWLHVKQYFYLNDLIRLDSEEIYFTNAGDELYFYLIVKDKAGNESVRKFIVEVI